MPHVLAIEPNSEQASALQTILRDHAGTEVLVVNSKESALSALKEGVPDLVLVSALLSPRDEADLFDCLKTLPNAAHLQTLTIPQLRQEAPSSRSGRSRFSMFSRRRGRPAADGCDPQLFAQEVSEYLARAAELKSEATALADQAALARVNPYAAARAAPEPATPTSGEERSASVTDTAGHGASAEIDRLAASTETSESVGVVDENIVETAQAAKDEVEEPDADGLAREVAEVQRAAEEQLVAELASVRQAAEERRATELAEVRRQAEALRDAEVREVRAATETEAAEALAAELDRVREQAEKQIADEIEIARAQAEEAQRVELIRVREEAERAFKAQLERARVEAAELHAEELATAQVEADRQREQATEDARAAGASAAAQAFEAELAQVRAEAETRLAGEVDRVRTEAEQRRAAELAEVEATAERLREDALREARAAAEAESALALDEEITRLQAQSDERLAKELERAPAGSRRGTHHAPGRVGPAS